MLVRKLFASLFVLVLLLPGSALAQAPLVLPSAEVDLWPEYDKPSMLVIYHLTLPPAATLPAQMNVRIPASAGSPSAVASRQPDGKLFTLPYNIQTSGEWVVVSFSATTAEVQIEYYDPALEKNNANRRYIYHWPGDYAVDSLSMQVQQPVGASNMSITPSLGNGSAGQDGLLYYTSSVGGLAAGQSFTLTISYDKSGDALSATELKVQPSAPIGTDTTGRMALPSILPWILGGLGLLLIVGGGVWYWLSGRETVKVAPRRGRRGAPSEAPRETISAEGGYIYCHQCGKRAAPGDRFCRTCGAQLRSS